LKRKSIRRLAIAVKDGVQDAPSFPKIIEALSKSFDLNLIKPARYSGGKSFDSLAEISPSNSDVVVSLGGDGTLLSVVRQMQHQLPVLGINLGGRGILNELELQDLPIAIERLREGRYYIEARIRLGATIEDKRLPYALNEFYLQRAEDIETPTFYIKYTGQTIGARMDGLMISTPTGSTGYSYSVGGPVIAESIEAYIITPVLPIYRVPSLVVPVSEVRTYCDRPFDVIVDGKRELRGQTGELVIGRAPPALFMRFTPRPFKQLKKLLSENALK
jgi:NAD+ kinase